MRNKIFLFIALVCLAAKTVSGEETNTLSLRQAEALAIQNHPLITAAELLALAARQNVREVRSGFFPSITASATAVGTTAENTRIAAGGFNNPLILERDAEGVNVSQLITDFGRTWNLTESSKLRSRAQDQSALATRAQILLEVSSAYFGARQAQSVLEVAQETVSTRQLLFNQVNELAKNKLKSGLDVSFAKVNLGQSKLLLASAQNDLQAQFATLANLLGEREQHDYRLVDETDSDKAHEEMLPTDDSQLVQTALRERPDLAQLRFEMNAAQRFVRAERDLNYPTISAVGAAGVAPIRDPALRDNYAAAGVNLSLPLFEGMLFSAREKEADYRAKAVAENLRDLENRVIRDVRIAAMNLSYAAQQMELTDELLASANESFNLAQARYKVGSSSIVELSQAQLSQTEARIGQARAKYEYQTREAILRFQLGELR